MALKAAILGGSGYTGGELLRLLLGHPEVEVTQVTSRNRAGKFVHTVHPNLRKRTQLKFIHPDALQPADVLFVCLPHGAVAPMIDRIRSLAPVIVDLSADFRLRDPAAYERWYGWQHPAPSLLREAVYGLPELHRAEIREANYIACPGCNATAVILGLAPLARAGVLASDLPVFAEAKVGSSGAGGEVGLSSHHPERSGVIRPYKPTGHRHTAEILQELGCADRPIQVALSVTSVEAVRGILATSYAFLSVPLTDRDLWQIYRNMYGNEPFVRIVKEASGLHRYPEPKILAGSNYCDVGWELDLSDPHHPRVVVMSAIDNLMKGAAGQAVQAMNVRFGFPETLGLEFSGLHPL
ncbi:MAG: N-acetyl-gamma-glutamyl-phosphate reductase [Thermorudis peleae]|nr:N-acetyl-gamma-glutamyl-phosphate reductase [Thermorudis peleae]